MGSDFYSTLYVLIYSLEINEGTLSVELRWANEVIY
jgi:hypothetical protein